MKPNQIIKSNEASTKTLILQIIQILPSMHACMQDLRILTFTLVATH